MSEAVSSTRQEGAGEMIAEGYRVVAKARVACSTVLRVFSGSGARYHRALLVVFGLLL